jgi:hypothetical protein
MGRVSKVQEPIALSVARLVLILAAGLLALGGCSSKVVKTANHIPVERVQAEIPEQLLLDVGIQIFDTGIEAAEAEGKTFIFPELRRAESRYFPYMLMETLQTSAAWGAVRVVPNEKNAVDVLVQGEILESDGELLMLKISVSDATGRDWFTKEYQSLTSKYSYDRRRREEADPFQGLYNEIANDMLAYRREELNEQSIAEVRTVAELRFAQNFSPEAFSDHVSVDKKGKYYISRLPAKNDPMLERIHRIRERDYLFVDTLQEYYGSFVRNMDQPYDEWRRQSYDEVIRLRELQRTARNRKIGGIAAILAGIAAAGSNNGSAATAGQVAVIGGGYVVKSGFDKSAQADIHVEALQELGDSLEAEIEPHVIEMEDRTITLSGTVENQYDQWREILKDIYILDTQGSVN